MNNFTFIFQKETFIFVFRRNAPFFLTFRYVVLWKIVVQTNPSCRYC